jgi:hypothetical protein
MQWTRLNWEKTVGETGRETTCLRLVSVGCFWPASSHYRTSRPSWQQPGTVCYHCIYQPAIVTWPNFRLRKKLCRWTLAQVSTQTINIERNWIDLSDKNMQCKCYSPNRISLKILVRMGVTVDMKCRTGCEVVTESYVKQSLESSTHWPEISFKFLTIFPIPKKKFLLDTENMMRPVCCDMNPATYSNERFLCKMNSTNNIKKWRRNEWNDNETPQHKTKS